jgi:hypothetical protein
MEDEVLRIQRDNVNAQRVVLILLGHVVAEWADLLERGCVTLSRSGFEALSRLSRAGVRILGRSPLFAAMLEQEGDRGEPDDAMKPAGVEPTARQSALASFQPKSKPWPSRTFERSPK